MALRKGDGTALTQSTFAALAPNDAAAPGTATFTENVYEDVLLPGTKVYEGAKRLRHRKGETILQSVRDTAYYATPTVTTVAPATGGTAGGTTVTLTGTNLLDATGVTFGGTAGTSFVVVSATKITVKTPAHAAAAVDVVVAHPAGNVTKAGAFTYA